MDSPVKKYAKLYFARSLSPSSLSKSPTMESGINKLSNLFKVEAGQEMGGKGRSRFALTEQNKNMLFEVLGCISYQLFELQMLLRPIALASVPFIWRYFRAGSAQIWIHSLDKVSLTMCFNLLITLIISITFLVCTWLFLEFSASESRAEFLYNIRSKPMRLWGCSSSEICGQIIYFLTRKRFNRYARSCSSVIWTIGSKRKLNKKHFGEWVQRYDNGDIYEGEFYQGKSSGSGVYSFYRSGKYEGDWVDGEFDGYGVETWEAGSRYRGQYKRGLRNGYGVYRFHNGDEYSGEWANGQSHGCGVQRCGDGSKYIGLFRSGMKHGFGCYHFRNGDTYAGEYFEDKLQGYGVYQFARGHTYEGAWHDGRKQGLGVYTFKNGDTHEGLWNCDAFQLPSLTNASIKSPSAVSHTKVLHAVQEARRAAAKALESPRVGDHVNKAVGAANRAANAARVAAVKAAQKKNVPSVSNA
ncbi:hypothetical protein O6H91_05G038000 [Diphasiastrum complanatum]|uniref:Uncharacterized protein n=1 Tax=Diphasiastrum complanatum TaxID=34168 RepID=A0ACC2DMU8_DIPCM|nr:hypothetical protein O6H91_05G038000 [Diphasiastrum complanatum]